MLFASHHVPWNIQPSIPSISASTTNQQHSNTEGPSLEFSAFEQWFDFDAAALQLNLEPFTNHEMNQILETHDVNLPDPYLVQTTPVAVDTPPTGTVSPKSTYTPSMSGSDSISSREASPAPYHDMEFERPVGSAQGQNGRLPQSLGRRAPSPANTAPSDDAAVGPSVSSTAVYEAYFENVAYTDSPRRVIAEAFDLLWDRLRQEGITGKMRHHHFLRCPVFDCDKGGYNPLLHDLINPSRKVLPSEADSDGDDSSSSGRQPGFFTFNELSRHVRSKHLPSADLRCHHASCKEQRILDCKADGPGTGTFSRVDSLRNHLKKYKGHRDSIPNELRIKYKLWKD